MQFRRRKYPGDQSFEWELLGIVTGADLFQLYLSLQHHVADLSDIAQQVVSGWLSGEYQLVAKPRRICVKV